MVSNESSDRLEGNPHKENAGKREQTVNNPVAIVDRETGSIEFLYCVNYARIDDAATNLSEDLVLGCDG